LCAWYKTGGIGPWTYFGGYLASAFLDLEPEDLSTWQGFFGVEAQAGGTVSYDFDNFVVGRFGSVGSRDWQAVTLEDGTPVNVVMPGSSGQVVAFTASCKDPQTWGYCGIFTLDLIYRTLTQIGVLFVDRGGKRMHDNAAHLVAADPVFFTQFHVLMTTWGDSPGAKNLTKILYKLESVNLLTPGTAYAISGMAALNLQGVETNGRAYDPSLIKNGPTWYLAFTTEPLANTNFYPVLNHSTDLSSWTLDGSDPTACPYEGTRIVWLAGMLWIVTASLADFRIYDLAMVYQGRLVVLPLASGAPPHPTILVAADRVYCVTFDNTLFSGLADSFGRLRVFRSRRYGVEPA
jgi:hypothetical protein